MRWKKEWVNLISLYFVTCGVKNMKIGAIILAAGSGTRLNGGQPSEKPKVLYEIAGKPMVEYSLELLDQIGIDDKVVVVGYQENLVKDDFGDKVLYASQIERKGTAHAAKMGEEKLPSDDTHLLIIQGDDSAFYKPETISQFIKSCENNKIGFTTVKLKEPGQYGRVIRNFQGDVIAIVEKESLTGEQKNISEVNAATYFVERNWFNKVYPQLKPSAVGKGEIIMPDLIELANIQSLKVVGFEVPAAEWVGVNTPEELTKANNLKQER